jgi:hypothetical protein
MKIIYKYASPLKKKFNKILRIRMSINCHFTEVEQKN